MSAHLLAFMVNPLPLAGRPSHNERTRAAKPAKMKGRVLACAWQYRARGAMTDVRFAVRQLGHQWRSRLLAAGDPGGPREPDVGAAVGLTSGTPATVRPARTPA
jgi:hypothetical protein